MGQSNKEIPTQSDALTGGMRLIQVPERHYVNGNRVLPPFPKGMQQAMFAMGCFWGVERQYWQVAGVYATSVGYSGGFTVNPGYEEVCTGQTGHAEVVRVVFDPSIVSYRDLLKIFWESHDPTQGMRQGGDIGTQYRSAIYTYNEEQNALALKSKETYQGQLSKIMQNQITTQIEQVAEFYFAEEYHQQYLAKNPNGYCGLGGLGVCYAAPDS